MKHLLLLISFSFIFVSCFKTAEEIKREKNVDLQIAQSSKTIAELTQTINSLKGQIASTSGQIEEIDHKATQSDLKQQESFSQTVAQLSEQVKILSADNLEIKKQLAEQKKYFTKVTGALSKISSSSSRSKSSLIGKAHKAFEKNKQKEAKKLYLQVLANNKVSAAKRNHVYYNLGLLEYWGKEYESAITYFSKIYTKYPRSSFAPRSLLQIARSFKKQKKKAEANAMFSEVIKKYPKSKQAKAAKKEAAK